MVLDKLGPVFTTKIVEGISDVFRVCNVFTFYSNNTKLSFAFML